MLSLLFKKTKKVIIFMLFIVGSSLGFSFKNTLAQSIITHPASIRKHKVDISPGEVYVWQVVTTNGKYTAGSDTWTFTVAAIGDVTGWVWDSTGKNCSDAGASNELQKSDLDGDVSINLTTQSLEGAWDPDTFDSYSYIVEEVPYSTSQILCVNVPSPVDKANFKYGLSCVNGSGSDIVSSSCATIDVDSSTQTYNLGYKMISSGWFNVIDGDVFGGCTSCVDSISIGIPSEDDILGSFADSLISGVGAVFANGSLSIKNPSGDDRYVNDDNEYYAESMENSEFWSDDFSFNAPDGSEEVSDCSDFFNDSLEAGSTYEADTDCINDALSNSGGSYSLSEDGVAVVYITDFDTLEFEGEFKSSNDDRRVLFVTNGDVLFSGDLGEVAPTSSSDPVVEAGIIAEASIVFESNGNEPADDTTIVVEGPLVSKDGTVDFDRDRGELNGYPAQVVIFNPIYLKELKETRSSVVDISWMVQQ